MLMQLAAILRFSISVARSCRVVLTVGLAIYASARRKTYGKQVKTHDKYILHMYIYICSLPAIQQMRRRRHCWRRCEPRALRQATYALAWLFSPLSENNTLLKLAIASYVTYKACPACAGSGTAPMLEGGSPTVIPCPSPVFEGRVLGLMNLALGVSFKIGQAFDVAGIFGFFEGRGFG